MAGKKYKKADEVRIEGNKIFSPVRQKWLTLTPEEQVRQQYLTVLIDEYGYSLDQIDEEVNVTGRGSAQARADFIIWRTAKDKTDQKAPFIIIECKADNVTIKAADYAQGENYARIADAPFFVTHNSRETKFWRVKKDKMPGYIEEIENIPHADASDKEIKELLSKLRVFKEKEFADLLHQCHNVIRNREKKDPAAAFDEIAKILFVKVWVERELNKKRKRKNLFSVDYLEEQLGDNPLDWLFQQTKQAYSEIIICDLTGHRPNVYVEAGYALKHHEQNRLIYLFEPQDSGDRVPFDLNTFKYVQISQAAEIQGRLIPEIKAILEDAGAVLERETS